MNMFMCRNGYGLTGCFLDAERPYSKTAQHRISYYTDSFLVNKELATSAAHTAARCLWESKGIFAELMTDSVEDF